MGQILVSLETDGILSHIHHEKPILLGLMQKLPARKTGIPIVSAVTVVETQGHKYLLRVHEAVYNQGSPTTLLSEFQLREHDCIVDSISTKHPTSLPGRNVGQCFLPRTHVYIPFIINGGLMTFRHHGLPTEQELASLTPIDITADSPWDPNSHYSDPCL